MSHLLTSGLGVSANELTDRAEIERKVRSYIIENLLLGGSGELENSTSLIEVGILDSTGAMELVSFIEDGFAVMVADDELVPDNLDSVEKICTFVARKQAARA
ncbi:MAG: acyl carrier protein [Rhodospirillales bacterium]|nr:acyl carrier protein [Rhodospirillales bacterium]